jgi:hypothetical protein
VRALHSSDAPAQSDVGKDGKQGSRLEIIEIADVGVLSDLPEQQNLDGTISESPLWHDKRPLPADRAPIDKPDPALHRYRVFAVAFYLHGEIIVGQACIQKYLHSGRA